MLCVVFASQVLAIDLRTIERTLRKEPAYQSKNPLYCLLVFGPAAKTRVWVVLDGDVLYVDRNGNGDLTDPGERIVAQDVMHRPDSRRDVEVLRIFNLRRPEKHPWETDADPILNCGPDVTWFHVMQLIPRDDWPDREWAKFWHEKPFDVAVNTVAGYEQRSRVRFAERPQDAPILHFDGPQILALNDSLVPFEFRGGETSELTVVLTTPGLDAEVRTDHARIPADVHPVAEIEFPQGSADGDPIRLRVELKKRC
jgi:hypothetical protein